MNQGFIRLSAYAYGFHLITDIILEHLPDLPEQGLCHIHLLHTSAGLTINENADPDVLHDFRLYFDHIVQERLPGMRHTLEGPDDMPAHIKSSLTGCHITLPITQHQLLLGQWQGIYLCEYRKHARPRTLHWTIIG